MAALYQIGDDGSKAERWELDEEPVVVGRSGQAKVSIEDEGVSRRHFLIQRDGEGYVIKDLNSRNGTWLAGRRVCAEKLHNNDCILAGHTVFLFADRPDLSTTAGKPPTGPHGTVMISAAAGPDRSPFEAILWQRNSANGTQTTPGSSNESLTTRSRMEDELTRLPISR